MLKKMHEDRRISLDDTITYIDHNGNKVKVQRKF